MMLREALRGMVSGKLLARCCRDAIRDLCRVKASQAFYLTWICAQTGQLIQP
jgi:hypothetical protein